MPLEHYNDIAPALSALVSILPLVGFASYVGPGRLTVPVSVVPYYAMNYVISGIELENEAHNYYKKVGQGLLNAGASYNYFLRNRRMNPFVKLGLTVWFGVIPPVADYLVKKVVSDPADGPPDRLLVLASTAVAVAVTYGAGKALGAQSMSSMRFMPLVHAVAVGVGSVVEQM